MVCSTHINAVDAEISLYSLRTVILGKYKTNKPIKHIFGKSEVKWLSNMYDITWFADEPSSKEMETIINLVVNPMRTIRITLALITTFGI